MNGQILFLLSSHTLTEGYLPGVTKREPQNLHVWYRLSGPDELNDSFLIPGFFFLFFSMRQLCPCYLYKVECLELRVLVYPSF